MPNKQTYADEMLRVLRPGGVLAVADWNCRELSNKPMTKIENLVFLANIIERIDNSIIRIINITRNTEHTINIRCLLLNFITFDNYIIIRDFY